MGRSGLAAWAIPLSFAVFAVAGGAVFLYGGLGAWHAANPGSDDWQAPEDFRGEFRRQAAAGLYPDSGAARCDGGVVKIRAHWAERPPGMEWRFFHLPDDVFASKNADLVGQGFALQYDNMFKNCDGLNRHLALWTKG